MFYEFCGRFHGAGIHYVIAKGWARNGPRSSSVKDGKISWQSLAKNIIKEGYETFPLASRTIATMPYTKRMFDLLWAGIFDLDVGFISSPKMATSVDGVEQSLTFLCGDCCRIDKPPPCDMGQPCLSTRTG